MIRSITAHACIVLIGVFASAGAAAHGVRFGFNLGFPIFAPYYYYTPPPAYYYPPQVISAPAPPVYIERNPVQAAQPQEHYWYYCADTQSYYPYVQECGSQWQRVSPRPPGT